MTSELRTVIDTGVAISAVLPARIKSIPLDTSHRAVTMTIREQRTTPRRLWLRPSRGRDEAVACTCA